MRYNCDIKEGYKKSVFNFWDAQDINEQLNNICLTSMAQDYIWEMEVPEEDEQHIFDLALDYCNERGIELD